MAEQAAPETTEAEANANLAQLRSKAERVDAAEARAAAAEKRIAFSEAGISTKEGTPGALLFENYTPDGDNAISAESVLEAATRFGIAPGTETPPAPAEGAPAGEPVAPSTLSNGTPEEQAFFKQSQQLQNGATPDAGDADPNESGFQAFSDRLANGSSREDASKAGMAEMFKGAAAGDKRVVYDRAEWLERNA